VNGKEDLLEKGFELAHFIFPSRSDALCILTGAMNKLKAQRGREDRRSYWRDKYLKRGITRITREECDTLQWLIFFESDQYEKAHEANGAPTLRDLVVRYIKNLVRMTTAMSSFHVNIGLHRLLHNYSTSETQRVYEAVTDKYPGADEYRRAKGVLMSKLEKRFGALLKTLKTQHGELRFEALADQAPWADLVNVCLKAFTPWSTAKTCLVPTNFDPAHRRLPSHLSGKGQEKTSQNEVEMNRCHAFIEPVCYDRLMHGLSFNPPGKMLALPRFFMENNNHENTVDQPPRAYGLTAEERKEITNSISHEAERRQKASPQSLTVLVDGVERARLDLTRATERQFDIEEGAELIEVRTEDDGESLLLAVHPVMYTEWQGIAPSRFAVPLKGGKDLVLTVSKGREAAEGPRCATVSASYRPQPSWWGKAESTPGGLRSVPKFAFISAVLIALGWVLGSVAHRVPTFQLSTSESVQGFLPKQQPTPSPLAVSRNAPNLIAFYTLLPDDVRVRGEGGPDVPSVMVPQQPTLLNLELPVEAADQHKIFRAALKSFLKEKEILSENVLTAKHKASGPVVVFLLPSAFLESNVDYVVDLRCRGAAGELEEVNTYTFHAVHAVRTDD